LKAGEIIEYGKNLFFPSGISTRGPESNFTFSLKDFKECDIGNEMKIEECILKQSYIYTTRKQSMDENENSDDSLPDPDFLSKGEKKTFEHLLPISNRHSNVGLSLHNTPVVLTTSTIVDKK